MSDRVIQSHSNQGRRAAKPSTPHVQPASAEKIPSVLPADKPVIAPPAAQGVQWSKVDLGPELPMAVFTSTEVWNPERIGALALYCCDGRWGEAFDEFCHKRLQLPRYDRLAIAGGPIWLAGGDKPSDLREALQKQLALLVKVHELERIVLINHYGCAVYRERLQRGPDECLPAQMDDLRAAAASLRGWFPDVRVEAYLAMQKGSSFSFHWLNT